ncbi:MAG: type IV secretion system DNA-binding domain-containing protein [bacterium]|nr:type IV secretion system DNA-binding domain-containing protein [bacterium]
MELQGVPKNKDLTYIGQSTYRDKNALFGIKRRDRRQHVYILGKSGTGKSVLMFNMIIQNIANGEGVCVVDPHGELVEGVLSAIPPDRVKDVVYFNPADVDHHIGFNVLELEDPKYKHLVASGLMGIFTKIWANAWSARMEYILNNAILALLDTPGTTLLGIPRLLVDKDYRQKIINNLKDPVIKAFWIHEYEAWQDKFRNEAIAPIQNKVGQFLSTSVIRNIVGQSLSTINIFNMMNEGKIFLVNVSKGRIGEDNSKLLGGMIITKVQLAAMERVRIPEEERKDFYLYVDEFQNFVTDSFASILSEARKYRLNLTVAHQYTAQLVTKESSAMRDSIFGNVGTMIVFRVGADDADFLEKEFAPEFVPEDIVNLPNFKIYLKLMIDGITSRPFSAKTLAPMVKGGDKIIEEEVIQSSRKLYCRTKEEVEREINNWSGMSLGDDNNSQNSEKFKVQCSICKKETFVPFEPTPGRSVYCRDCIAKMKSGELVPIKGSMNQVKQDEGKFYKPLADLGIEFTDNGQASSSLKEIPKSVTANKTNAPNIPPKTFNNINKPINVISNIKKVLNSDLAGSLKSRPLNTNNTPKFIPKNKPEENLALKEILNKTLSENKTLEPAPVSINTLKTPPTPSINNSKDRGATEDRMSALKNAILSAQKTEEKVVTVIPTPVPQIPKPTPISIKSAKDRLPQNPTPSHPNPPTPPVNTVKEVPEEVLRKILEEEN